MLYIGNHTSSAKGYASMARQTIANGGNTFAFFTRNPRGGKAKEIDPEDVAKYQVLAAGTSLREDCSSCTIYTECLCCQRKSSGFCQRYHER